MRYLIFLFLSGCATTIDFSRSPPADWPTLQVTVIKTNSDTVKQMCRSADLMIAFGCAVPNFTSSHCYVYLATDDPDTIAHEKLHCLGYDHHGESTMRDAWAKWNRMRE